jgi:hypothetical protein
MAGNLLSGPEIPPLGPEFPPLDKISGPFKIRLSPLQNVVVQRSVKGPEILVWQNFRGPEKFLALENLAKSFTTGCGAACREGPEILSIQNFRGAEIPEFLALENFAKSFSPSCGAPCSKGPEFLAQIFRNENFRGVGNSAPRPEFPP